MRQGRKKMSKYRQWPKRLIDEVVNDDAVVLLKKLNDNSIPLIIADPPYGIAYHSNHYKDKNPHSPVAYDWNFQISAFVRECERVLCEGGALYLFSRWDVFPLWLPIIESSALKIKTKIVWVKNNWSAGDLQGNFGNQYEEILFTVKGRHIIRGRRWPNVWEFPRIPASKMLVPTQKPVGLLRRAIVASSDQGDLVVDPFSGSGSTGLAAKEEHRKFLLGDVNPKMVRLSRVRVGLSVQDESEETEIDYLPTLPDPTEWGIHPEEERFILDELKSNHIEYRDGQLQMPPFNGG
jgi:site-specific DNA-methyltransferase (adenine-specific)